MRLILGGGLLAAVLGTVYANSIYPMASCDENVLEICRDSDTYPNIGKGFRGYNPIRGDPLAENGDPGYEAHIFDEETERHGKVRFGNTAGHDLNRCDGNVAADFLSTAEDFLESVTTSEGSSSSFDVGPEMDISGSISFKDVVEVGVERTIPPLYQSMSSNSKIMTNFAGRMSSEDRKVTRTRFTCSEYSFDIKGYQHPVLASSFKAGVKDLEDCLIGLNSYNDVTQVHDNCVRIFFDNFGTHYIESATFGSMMSVLTLMEANVLNSATRDQTKDCSTENDKWSFLGFFGGGSVSNRCENSLFNEKSRSRSMLLNEEMVTVGSRPQRDYTEWAAQSGNPEIVEKTIAPISDLFTDFFMDSSTGGRHAAIKPILEKYTIDYCRLFPSDCNFVVKRNFCIKSGSVLSPCICIPNQSVDCGVYTGPVDINFLPHGKGSLTINGKLTRRDCVHGSCQVIDPPGARINLIIIKTSTADEAKQDGPATLKAKVCDAGSKCCSTGTLDTPNDDFEQDRMDAFNSLGGCQNFEVDPTHPLSLTLIHSGTDGWKGDYVNIVLSDGTVKNCAINIWIDDDEEMTLYCSSTAATTTSIAVKTADRTSAECDCGLSLEICDKRGSCCRTGTLDTENDDRERDRVDIYFRQLGGCAGFPLDTTGALQVRALHTGDDGWLGEWIRILLSNGSSKQCTFGSSQWLDDDGRTDLNCI